MRRCADVRRENSSAGRELASVATRRSSRRLRGRGATLVAATLLAALAASHVRAADTPSGAGTSSAATPTATITPASLGSGAAGTTDAVAARVGAATISLADVDQRCGGKCARLLAEIAETRRHTLAQLVDELLLASHPAPTPSAVPVTDAEVDAEVLAHADELTGPPERDRAAARFLLERQRARERDQRLIDAQRSRIAVVEPLKSLNDETPEPDAVAARVGEREILVREIDARVALALYRLRGELARERRRVLDGMVDEQLWAQAAARRGVSVEALRAHVHAEAPKVTEDDIARYFAQEVLPRDPDAVRNDARIRPYLEFRARRAAEEKVLVETKRATAVEILIAEPAPPRLDLHALPGATRGRADAPIEILLLTSYRGDASRRTWATVREAAADAPDVRLAVRPLLPQWDPEATLVAASVRCAAEQGRWWAMHDAAASAEPLPDRAALDRLAADAGLDQGRFAACVASPATARAIAEESAAAERLGLVQPPVVLVDGRAFGAPSPERLAAAIADARRARDAAGRPSPALSGPSSSASASP